MSKPPLKSVEEKTRIVMAVLRGEVTVAAAARREGVSETTIAKWRDRFLDGGRAAIEAGNRPGSSSRVQRLEADVAELTSALGEAHMELRLWRKGGALYPVSRSSKRHGSMPS
jgi:transposase